MKRVILSLLLLMAAGSAFAVPDTIRFQGRITDNAGNPLPGDSSSVRFTLFTAATGGSQVWTSTLTQVSTNEAGLFSADLGPFQPDLFVDYPQLFLEIYVYDGSNFRKLSPRQKLGVVPYAFEAIHASSATISDGAISTEKIKDGAVTTAKIAPEAVTDAQIEGVSAAKLTTPILSTQIASVSIEQVTGLSGVIVAFGGISAPDGWLMCDGAAVSRTVYANLFSVIGTSFGAGNGVTTFNVPDLRGRFLRGVDGTAGRDPDKLTRGEMASGGTTGNGVGSVQGESTRSHTHGVNDPGHRHNLDVNGSFGVVAVQFGGPNERISGGGGDGGSFRVHDTLENKTGISIAAAGGAETRPLNANVNYIIKQ